MSDTTTLTVESVDNHVMFYSDIDADRALALMRELRQIDNRLLSEKTSRGVRFDVPIWLHINSGGGGAFDSFALVDQITALHAPVYSIVEGMAASGASLLAMACKKRYITANSFMMIHQLSAMAYGTHEAIKDTVHVNEMLMENMYGFYVKHSNLDRERVIEMLKRDTWCNAADALAYGFVDEIGTGG